MLWSALADVGVPANVLPSISSIDKSAKILLICVIRVPLHLPTDVSPVQLVADVSGVGGDANICEAEILDGYVLVSDVGVPYVGVADGPVADVGGTPTLADL